MSKKLDASMAYLQLQLGVNCCPLDLNYDDWHYLAPLSWIKMLWRTLQVTGFELHLEYKELPFPRIGDRLVMDVLREACAVRAQVADVRELFVSVVEMNDAGLDVHSLSNGKGFSVHVETRKVTSFVRRKGVFELEATVPKYLAVRKALGT